MKCIQTILTLSVLLITSLAFSIEYPLYYFVEDSINGPQEHFIKDNPVSMLLGPQKAGYRILFENYGVVQKTIFVDIFLTVNTYETYVQHLAITLPAQNFRIVYNDFLNQMEAEEEGLYLNLEWDVTPIDPNVDYSTYEYVHSIHEIEHAIIPALRKRGVDEIKIETKEEVAYENPTETIYTEWGVIHFEATKLTTELPVGTLFSMVVDHNGEREVTRLQVHENRIHAFIVLFSGENLLTVVLHNEEGKIFARSQTMTIHNRQPVPKYQFFLTWDAQGDLDLHVDNGHDLYIGDIHCYYFYSYEETGEKKIKEATIFLDEDNTLGYGPENIRIYEYPTDQPIRCFVNYYRGRDPVHCQLKLYLDGKLIRTFEHTFQPERVDSSSGISENSWVVTEFTFNDPPTDPSL